MHPALLNAYSTMLPQLQAEESVRAANIIGVGTGSLKKHDRQTLLGQWSRQMGAATRLKPGKPGSLEFEATMAGAGFGVKIVPPKAVGIRENSDE